MADVTKITLPNGTTKDIKDSTARSNVVLLETMNGAKNIAPYNSGEHTGNASYWFIHSNCIDIAAGTSLYLVYDYTQTAGQISIQLTDSNGNIISGTSSYSTKDTTSGHKATKVTVPSGNTAKGYNAYHSANATVTVSNFMIIPAEIYEAGFTSYQPYALSNAELTTKEIQNESNILSSYDTTAFACSAADTYEYTGISITCPANKLIEIWIVDEKGSAMPSGILISDSNSNIATAGSVIAENSEQFTVNDSAVLARELHCIPPRIRNTNKTFYVWVKRTSTASNNIHVITRAIVTS